MTFLDNSSTTRPDDSVVQIAMSMMTQDWGNPASLHFMGSLSLNAVNTARCQVAQLLCAPTNAVFFCSSGTMANNLVLEGCVKGKGSNIVSTSVEHSSILKTLKSLENDGFEVRYVRPSCDGKVSVSDVLSLVDENTALVSVMAVNNEVGSINPIAEIAEAVHSRNPKTLVHTDLVQGFGKMRFSVTSTGVDFATVSGHKIHGLKGSGAVYVKTPKSLSARVFGGSQESGFFPGTESVEAWCGMGQAAYNRLCSMDQEYSKVLGLRNHLVERLSEIPNAVLNSSDEALPYVVNFSLVGDYEKFASFKVVSFLSSEDVFVSAGAACEKGRPSHVLQEMGLSEERVNCALRVSLSHMNSIEDIDTFIATLKSYIGQ